jgi:hypothetical protein
MLLFQIRCKGQENDLVKKIKKVSPKTFFMQLIDTHKKRMPFSTP